MTTSNKPPSVDLPPEFYRPKVDPKPELKECPFCEGDPCFSHEINPDYVTCLDCGMDGPFADPNGRKWNAIPRRSEVKELLRLVEEFKQYHELETIGKSACFQQMVIYANRIRKEYGL